MTEIPIAMPALLYGTAWKKLRTASLVENAIRAGFRGIDTACQPKHYHEPGVGIGVHASLADASLGLRREDLYLQTKYTPVDGQDRATIPYNPQADLHSQVVQSVAASLANLQTEYIDCLILHSPLLPWADTLIVWSAMESQVDSTKVRRLGISNCYELSAMEGLYRQARIKPSVLQNRFYADTGFDRELRAFCLTHNIQYQSFWTLTANPELLATAQVRALAHTYHVTVEQIFLRYLTQMHVAPLTGTASIQHMHDDLAIFAFALTGAECQTITELLDQLSI